MNDITFLYFDVCDTSWELTSYTVFAYFYLSLDGILRTINGEITNDSYDDYHRYKAQNG